MCNFYWQARIDAELRDKEEWEAQQYELERQREEEEKRRREHRREMLGDTLQEVDVNEIGNGKFVEESHVNILALKTK